MFSLPFRFALPPFPFRGQVSVHLCGYLSESFQIQSAGLGAPPRGGRLPSRVRDMSRRAPHGATRILTCPGENTEKDVLDRSRGPRTTRKTPWPCRGPRCCARARLGRAFQSIENRLYNDRCHAVSRPGLFQTLNNHTCLSARTAHRTPSKVRKPTFPLNLKGIPVCNFVLAIWRNLHTGAFCAPEGEQRHTDGAGKGPNSSTLLFN